MLLLISIHTQIKEYFITFNILLFKSEHTVDLWLVHLSHTILCLEFWKKKKNSLEIVKMTSVYGAYNQNAPFSNNIHQKRTKIFRTGPANRSILS